MYRRRTKKPFTSLRPAACTAPMPAYTAATFAGSHSFPCSSPPSPCKPATASPPQAPFVSWQPSRQLSEERRRVFASPMNAYRLSPSLPLPVQAVTFGLAACRGDIGGISWWLEDCRQPLPDDKTSDHDRDRSGVIAQPFRPRIALVVTGLPQASGYFFVKPQCVPPPYLLPSVKHPFLRQALYLSSHSGPPLRPMHVLFHVEHMSAATAGVPNGQREAPRTTKQAAISLLRMMCILPLTVKKAMTRTCLQL